MFEGQHCRNFHQNYGCTFFSGDFSQCSPGWYPTAKGNETVNFVNLHICGFLANLIDLHFYPYDSFAKEFAFSKTLVVNITRDVEFADMISGMYFLLHTQIAIDQTCLVSNKIFSVILTAYIDSMKQQC